MRQALSTPFCRLTSSAVGATTFASASATASVATDFTHTSTTSASRSAARSVDDAIGTRVTWPALVSSRPAAFTASAWAARPTSVTRTPARASMAPKKLPTAPAPITPTYRADRAFALISPAYLATAVNAAASRLRPSSIRAPAMPP